MKSLFGCAAAAVMVLGLAVVPSRADMAHWAETRARAQVASQMVADNLHRMR